jgi:dipeptidyl aminopeptidase/acylaminoacyl peptidase
MSGNVDQEAGVWRPDAQGQKFPLISFSHGYSMGGENVWGHGPLLADLASAGYIIVAHKSGGSDGGGKYTSDQIRVFEWAR